MDESSELTRIALSLERILANQEAYLQRFEEHVKEDKTTAAQVESIQTKMNYGIGAFAALSIVWGIVGSFIMTKLGLK